MKRLISFLGTMTALSALFIVIAGPSGGGGGGSATSLAYNGLTPTKALPAVPSGSAGFSTNPAAVVLSPSGASIGCILSSLHNATISATNLPGGFGQTDTASAAGPGIAETSTHVVIDPGFQYSVAGSNWNGSIAICQGPPHGLLALDCHGSAIAADGATSGNGPTCTTTLSNDLCVCWMVHQGSSGSTTMTTIPSGGAQVITTSVGITAAQFPMAAVGTTTACAATDAGGTSTKGWTMFLACYGPTGN